MQHLRFRALIAILVGLIAVIPAKSDDQTETEQSIVKDTWLQSVWGTHELISLERLSFRVINENWNESLGEDLIQLAAIPQTKCFGFNDISFLPQYGGDNAFHYDWSSIGCPEIPDREATKHLGQVIRCGYGIDWKISRTKTSDKDCLSFTPKVVLRAQGNRPLALVWKKPKGRPLGTIERVDSSEELRKYIKTSEQQYLYFRGLDDHLEAESQAYHQKLTKQLQGANQTVPTRSDAEILSKQ